MVVNGQYLLMCSPIKGMLRAKEKEHGVSHGLGEAGYDIRIKQAITFYPRSETGRYHVMADQDGHLIECKDGFFALASSVEEFQMPPHLMGIVHDKSTWARQGLSVFNTVIEPGWNGFLTLELVYHGENDLVIPAGAGIAQVIFHKVTENAQYTGKYQDQADEPVASRASV